MSAIHRIPAESATAESAMTEIALALAMGFFSLMVLTLISMGAGTSDSPKQAASQSVQLVESQSTAPASGNFERAEDDVILIFDGQRFLGPDLEPVDPARVAADAGTKRVVLALDPNLPLKQALAARAQVNAPNTLVAPLDEAWLATLKTLGGSHD